MSRQGTWFTLLLASAISAACRGEVVGPADGGPDTADDGLTMSVIVTSTVPAGAAATVTLTGPGGFTEQTASTSFGSPLTFTELPPGTYTVAATVFGFICQAVSATVQRLQTTMVNITCTSMAGTITGVITSDGSPLEGILVTLSGGAGAPQTRTAGANGRFTFSLLAGEYVVTASHQNHICPVQTVLVEPEHTATADIACTPKPTGIIVGTVTFRGDPGSVIFGATISLSGPVSRTAIYDTDQGFLAGPLGSFFLFDELPPGTYTVAATSLGLACESVGAAVQAAQTTAVEISCVFRPPSGSEIAGNWRYSRLLRSQTGNCPVPLPEMGTGSIALHPGNDTIEIVGLDPALAVTGAYDEGSGIYTGSGTTVLGDGSTVRTDLAATFAFDDFDSVVVFFTDVSPSHVWTRQHRDSSGNLVCTEVYGAGGGRFF